MVRVLTEGLQESIGEAHFIHHEIRFRFFASSFLEIIAPCRRCHDGRPANHSGRDSG